MPRTTCQAERTRGTTLILATHPRRVQKGLALLAVELGHDLRGLMRHGALAADGVGQDWVDLVLAPRHVAERHLERLRRLFAVELDFAPAIERGPVRDDGEAAVVGIRLDPAANLHSGGSERERRQNGNRQRLPSGHRQCGGSYQSTNRNYSSQFQVLLYSANIRHRSSRDRHAQWLESVDRIPF